MKHIIVGLSLIAQSLTAGALTNHSDVESYHNHSTLPWTWAINTIERYDFSGHHRVLDIGSGDGKVMAWMQENKLPNGIVIGIDISPAMQQFVTTHYPSNAYPQLIFLQGDVLKLPFLNQFDLVTSFLCLHWVSDQHLALQNIHHALAPEGKILLVLPAKSPHSHTMIADNLRQTDSWKQHFQNFIDTRKYFNASEFTHLLLEENFTPVTVLEIPTVTVFENEEDFKAYFRLISQHVQHLPDDLQEDFMNDVVKELINFHRIDADGKIHYELIKLEVIAEKNGNR